MEDLNYRYLHRSFLKVRFPPFHGLISFQFLRSYGSPTNDRHLFNSFFEVSRQHGRSEKEDDLILLSLPQILVTLFSSCQCSSIYGLGNRLLLHFLWTTTSLLLGVLVEPFWKITAFLWNGYFCHRRDLCRLAHREPNEESQRHVGMERCSQHQHGPGGRAVRGHGLLRLPQIRRGHQGQHHPESPSWWHVNNSSFDSQRVIPTFDWPTLFVLSERHKSVSFCFPYPSSFLTLYNFMSWWRSLDRMFSNHWFLIAGTHLWNISLESYSTLLRVRFSFFKKLIIVCLF